MTEPVALRVEGTYCPLVDCEQFLPRHYWETNLGGWPPTEQELHCENCANGELQLVVITPIARD